MIISNPRPLCQSLIDVGSIITGLGSYTMGKLFHVTHPGSVIKGLEFLVGVACTIKCSLWTPHDFYGVHPLPVRTVSVVCPGAGVHQGLFALPYTVTDLDFATQCNDTGYANYWAVGIWEESGSNYFESSSYPQFCAQIPYANKIGCLTYSFHSYPLYYWGAGDAFPGTGGGSCLPLDVICDYEVEEPANEVFIVRTPICGLYTDDLRDTSEASRLQALNMVPEDYETGVPHNCTIRLHIASLDAIALDALTKIYVTRSSNNTRYLAYDQAAGGFQTGFDGALSSATVRASPSSGVDDELVLIIDATFSYTSLEVITVEVQASVNVGAIAIEHTYSFTIEDISPPTIEEILWLSPTKARLKFNEPVSTSQDPGGSRFVQVSKGNVEIISTSQIKLYGVTPSQSWIGYWMKVTNSDHPANNQFRPITSVSVSTNTITVNTASIYGGPLHIDDGHDYDDHDRLVQTRDLWLSISPYMFVPRLTDEGASAPEYSADKTQVSFCPFVIAAELPEVRELPAADNNPAKYVYLTFNEDISYGRLYAVHAIGIQDIYENEIVDSSLDFESPLFGVAQNALGFWSDGVLAASDKTEDLDYERNLRKLAVVLQDGHNIVRHRIDQIQYLEDPTRCPTEWIDHLLYNRGNPFRFPLETENLKRKLAAALPGFYKKVGTAEGIKEMLYLVLGINFDINAYITQDAWIIGDATYGRLGVTTVLGPGSQYARNSYDIRSPVDLTDTEYNIVREIAEWADPAFMHLIRIIQPSDEEETPFGWWVLGVSALGVSTKLGG